MSSALIDARGYSLRHVHPISWRASEGATTVLLGRDYGYTWLPISHLPTSADLVEGTHSGRLGDSGELSLTFPNAPGSKGLWREMFSTDLSLQFIEVYRDDVLEFVGSIQRLEVDRGSVQVSGPDAWSLLRRAYESDRSWTAAPQEVAMFYTRVPVTRLADDFDGVALAAGWAIMPAGHVTAPVANGRVRVTVANDATLHEGIEYDMGAVLGDNWRATIAVAALYRSGAFGITLRNTSNYISIETIVDTARADLVTDVDGGVNPVAVGVEAATPLPITVIIERQGRWVRSYVNGRLTGFAPFQSALGVDRIRIEPRQNIGVGSYVAVESVVVTELLSFLSRGADHGDYVLPGDQPTGGLHGRYFNDADLQGLTTAVRKLRILAPDRAHYAERLDPVIDTSGGLVLPLQPGASSDFYSIRWFGSVYLRGDLGDYVFETTSTFDGVRLWVGKTAWGDQIIDDWNPASGTSTATWDASDHGSNAGWYPLVLEYFLDTTGPAITLKFTPPGTTYTDPGGTSITASTKRVIPSSSLSPLGCYDNRVQGQPHFDLVQQAASQFGYQLWCEPMQLESGEFPGRLVPRVRVGRDTDKVLEAEDTDRVEPAISPGLTLDGSDQAVTLIGTGAGIADGAGSQISAEISDLTAMGDALFNLTTYVDAGDASQRELVEARLNAELALRGPPWEEVRATPRAQEQLADTWPLTSTLSAMRWRPGDGIRISVPDVGIVDAEPRQIMQVTRTFASEGRTGTQVGLRQRPRSAARSAVSLLKAALAQRRSYQGQKVTLAGAAIVNASTAAAGATAYSVIPLLPGDKVVRAILRITQNSTAQALSTTINNVDRTSALGGPWSNIPVEIDVTAYATQAGATDNRFFALMTNGGGSTTLIDFQLVAEVLR